jgi:hypothetical protein
MAAKDDAAKKLAEMHYRIESGITRIFRIRGSAENEIQANEPIKLLEINRDTVSAGVMPLRFDPVPGRGIPFSSVIVEITPDEFEQLCQQKLLLPDGWKVAEPLPKPKGKGL